MEYCCVKIANTAWRFGCLLIGCCCMETELQMLLEIRFSVMKTTAQDDRLLLNVRTTPKLPCAVLPCPTLCLPCSALLYVLMCAWPNRLNSWQG